MLIYLATQCPEAASVMEYLLNIAVLAIEAIGAALIVISVVLGMVEVAWATVRHRMQDAVTAARFRLAQRMVLALEFLIAADILKTITTPTLEGMALLGAIIAIRTILSLSIAYELRRPHGPPQPSAPSDTKGEAGLSLRP